MTNPDPGASTASQQQSRQTITEPIVAALESGDMPPWQRPWRVGPHAGFPANVVSCMSYRGINPLLLELVSERRGMSSRWWGTFDPWRQPGGNVMPRPSHVPPGRWGTIIVFWTPVTKTERDGEGDEKTDRDFVMRSDIDVNTDRVKGPPPRPHSGERPGVEGRRLPPVLQPPRGRRG